MVLKIINFLKNKLNVCKLHFTYKKFLHDRSEDNLLIDIPTRLSYNFFESPVEYFSHYESFCVWATKIIKKQSTIIGSDLNILDLGGLKLNNALLAEDYKVSSIVLADCDDKISNVKYIYQDASKPLQLGSKSYDIFTSPVSLQLIGFGRYGDKLDPNALCNLIGELDRVLKNKSHLIISISYGKNILEFNRGYILDLQKIKILFNKWNLVDYIIDNNSSGKGFNYNERFTKDLRIKNDIGDYRVIFLHFER